MAILRGFKDQLLHSRRMRNGELSIVGIEGIMIDGNDEMNDYYAGIVTSSASAIGSDRLARDTSVSHPSEQDMFALRFNAQNDRFADANTGLPLDEGLCRAARQKEIEYFVSKGVWELRTTNEA